MRFLFALLAVVVAATACAMESPDSVGTDVYPSRSTSSLVEPSTSEATTTTMPAPTSTSEVPITTTTTIPRSASESPWVGVEFSVAISHPIAEGIDILANVEHFPVEFLVDGEPAGVFGWYVGGVWDSFVGPDFSVVAVGDEPNPYAPTAWEQ